MKQNGGYVGNYGSVSSWMTAGHSEPFLGQEYKIVDLLDLLDTVYGGDVQIAFTPHT